MFEVNELRIDRGVGDANFPPKTNLALGVLVAVLLGTLVVLEAVHQQIQRRLVVALLAVQNRTLLVQV